MLHNHIFIKALLWHGADPNTRNSDTCKTQLLQLASVISKDDIQNVAETLIVKELLKHNANVAAKDYKGNKVLHYLAKQRAGFAWIQEVAATNKARKALIKDLMKASADVNAVNDREETPLSLAIQGFNLPIIESVLSKNARKSFVPTSSQISRLKTLLRQLESLEPLPEITPD